MSKISPVLAIIPARGGSKGIPRKNLRLLAGRPLVIHTIEQALAARRVDRVAVSTEDAEIAAVAKAAGAEVVARPEALASDSAPTEPVMIDALEALARAGGPAPETVVLLQCTSPLRTAAQIGKALAYAHGQKIIHRNVTPKNILIDAASKEAKLGDLMKAKALEGILAKQITRPGELIGDVAYMSPERTRGSSDVDGRADIYGLGATVYALLTGRPPFDGATLVEKITKIRKDDPVKPTKYQLSIPALFEGTVMKMLAKRPEDRFQSAAELVGELERVAKFQGMTV